MHLNKYIQSSIIFLITLQLTSSNETNAPVYEVINEQARTDDKIRVSSSPGTLPYGNPLAGNSKQNARLHASNQQAMFNAERVRQHKAQLQRWNQGPQIIDSYMKAYHELQENHQLEVEQQQATLKDVPVSSSPRPSRTKQRGQIKQRGQSNTDSQTERQPSKRVTNQRKQLPRRGSQRIDPVQASKGDVLKDTRNRNHRSYGSADYNQQLEPKRYQTVYVSPVPSYHDHVIDVKPNLNIGSILVKEPSKLYTNILSSDAKIAYPKHLDQKFTSVQEIEALNSLLAKNPEQQLTEFTALIKSDKNEEINKNLPSDFYIYLKNPTQTQNVPSTKSTYTDAFIPVIKDHTPITEEIDDIDDPSQQPLKNVPEPTVSPKIETATSKSNNYYKLEVASQTITNDKPYLHYGYQEGDKSERYLHHNAQTTGLQHLLEDGTETSAYEDNVSIKVRNKRSKLETEPFLLPEKKLNNSDTPTSEALVRVNPFHKKRDSLDVYLPSFPIGEASYDDYDYDYKKSNHKLQSFYDDDYYDDFSSPEYDFDAKSQNFGPSGYQVESKGSFSNKLRHFRRVPLSSIYGTPPSTSYGVPFYGSPSLFSSPQSYFPQKIESTVSSLRFENLEPVYMLTQSQLKDLVGHNNLNIEHLDVYQLTKSNNRPKKLHYPRNYRKRYPFKHVRNNLFKLHKFNA